MTADPEDEVVAAAQARRTLRIKRWSYFLLLLVVTATTLFFLLRSGTNGDLVGIRYPGFDTWGNPNYLTITSTYAHLKFEKRGVAMPGGSIPVLAGSAPASAGSASRAPLFVYRRGYSDVRVGEKFSLHYGWILGVECLAFFFLVPSVITRAGRHPVAVDDPRQRPTDHS